jgi:hypothetical protein
MSHCNDSVIFSDFMSCFRDWSCDVTVNHPFFVILVVIIEIYFCSVQSTCVGITTVNCCTYYMDREEKNVGLSLQRRQSNVFIRKTNK